MADATIIRCPQCGKPNRVRPAASGVPRCASCHSKLPWLVEADTATFEAETRASVPVVVDFWAPWCGPCRMVSPILERLASSNAGHLKMVKVNIDTDQGLARRFQVQGIPLIVLMKDGVEVDRRVGALPEAQLSAWLAPHIGAA